MQEAFTLLSPPLKGLLQEAGIRVPTPPQAEAIPFIMQGENVLVIAPTGSGKTEAALLPLIDKMVQDENRQGISLLYITPLRALNRDLLKRLQIWSVKLGFQVEVRHGDTPVADRRRMAGRPPDLLITTPETLQAILPGKRMRQHLRHVKAVVVDEVHELAGNRRGVQLTVGLERLREVRPDGFQRIGLSATVGNPEEISRFLGGSEPVRIVQIPLSKDTRYKIEYPTPGEEDQELARRLYTAPEAAARLALVSDLVDAHDSTLIFVNSRVNAEMLGSKFNLMGQNIMVHHGSLPKEERVRAEEAFKARQVKGLVCTSTLELGIDIGSVDLVVQYMSPRQVNSLVQRVGRSGHSLTRTSHGVLVSVSTEDLLESIGVIELAKEGRLEPTVIHHRALDVLAHQVAGLLMDSEGSVSLFAIKEVVRRAFPYSQLEEAELEKVVEFMRKMGYLRRDDQTLFRTSRTRMYYYENLSMIPDERRYQVVDLTNQQSVGILGEEFMLTMAHVGLNFIVKGRVWQMKQITDDGKVYVLPINDPTAAIPGWDGQILPVPGELAVRVGEYRKQINKLLDEHKTRAPVVEKFSRIWPADPYGVRRVVEEIETHRATGAPVPTNERVLVEGFDRYIIIHTHFGDVLNFTLGEVIEELFRRQGLVRMWWWDSYRILYEMTADTADLDLEDLFLKQVFGIDEPVLGGACHGVLHRHFPWELQMKQIAERFGALSRGRLMYGGAMKELQVRFRLTPIYDETIREAQVERADFEGVKKIFKQIKQGNMDVRFFRSKDKPTPLAYHLLYRHVDIPELVAPENVAADNMARLRISIEGRAIDLLCFDCANLTTEISVASLLEHPSCQNCGSALLAPVFWSSAYVTSVLRKKRNKQSLDESEQRALTRARRSADLVIAYGRRAVIAQSVYGIGPQTASRVLAKMHESDDEFYKDLLEAKLQFITTRPYWNN
ncbi:MAG TPA: DEAD/DEAH box helicase [Candidatus Dormibacteraeota bacterium]|nr:DEAD/DEAH box helicase [Candidatus Dormibacteraeota bacterium]